MLQNLRVAVFLALLVVPLAWLDSRDVADTGEKRTLARFPSLRAEGQEFPEKFDAWFADHFGLRSRMIGWHNQLKVLALHQSPSKDVIIGDDGWLFYAAQYDGIDIRDFAGRYPLKPERIQRWVAHQVARKQQYAGIGARYLVVLIPNKQTVYADDVPARYGPHAPGVLDGFVKAARSEPELEVLDLRPVFEAHRGEPLFYRTDSHWNDNGAFLAAESIVERLRFWFPGLAPLGRANFEVTAAPRTGGDLAETLGLRERFGDTEYTYRSRTAEAAVLRLDPLHVIWEKPDAPLRVMLLGDSFSSKLGAALANAFGYLHLYYSPRGGYDEKTIREEKPDVVVLALCERYLTYLGSE